MTRVNAGGWLVVLVSLALYGCSATPKSGAPTAQPSPTSGGLPALDTLTRPASFFDVDQLRLGAEFEPDLPHRGTTVMGESVVLDPAASDTLGGLAFCLYRFDLAGFDEEDQRIYLEFVEPLPLEPAASNLFIAVADWERGRWDIRPLGGLSALFDPGTPNRFIRADGLLVAAVLAYNGPAWTLEHLRVGYDTIATPTQAERVGPPNGSTGRTVRFRVSYTGSAPDFYAWNFGAGAEPQVSIDAAPLVLLGAAGTYSGSVTIGNRLGYDTLEFTYEVLPAGNWVRTLNIAPQFAPGPLGEPAWAVAGDSAGNVYVGGNALVKLNPSGQVLWNARPEHFGLFAETTAIAVAPNDSVYCLGVPNFGSWGDNGSTIGLAHYTANGQLLWLGTLTTGARPQLAVDNLGAAVLLPFEDFTRVIRIDHSGQRQWAAAVLGANLVGLAHDGAGSLLLAGTELQTGTELHNTAVLKLDATGLPVYAHTWELAGFDHDWAGHCRPAPDSGVFISGSGDFPLWRDTGTQPEITPRNFILRADPSGAVLWASAWERSDMTLNWYGYEEQPALALQSDGSLLCCSTVPPGTSFGGPLSSLLRFDADGVLQGLWQLDGDQSSRGYDLALAADGSVLMAGGAQADSLGLQRAAPQATYSFASVTAQRRDPAFTVMPANFDLVEATAPVELPTVWLDTQAPQAFVAKAAHIE
jgi:hypothetical protein